ncbi:MAG TPA: hypothetical protein VJR29_02905 [bacterium]|nr:hypothetical protein [bacterium]
MESSNRVDYSRALVDFNPVEKLKGASENQLNNNIDADSLAAGAPFWKFDDCGSSKVTTALSYTATALNAYNWKISEGPRLSEMWALSTSILALNSGIQHYHSWRTCRGPGRPQGPQDSVPTLNNPGSHQDSAPIRNLDKGMDWGRVGWSAAGALAAVGAAVLLFVPFDGPAGEAALGSASLAAFANAGF